MFTCPATYSLCPVCYGRFQFIFCFNQLSDPDEITDLHFLLTDMKTAAINTPAAIVPITVSEVWGAVAAGLSDTGASAACTSVSGAEGAVKYTATL
jgi:hypothetical protein